MLASVSSVVSEVIPVFDEDLLGDSIVTKYDSVTGSTLMLAFSSVPSTEVE